MRTILAACLLLFVSVNPLKAQRAGFVKRYISKLVNDTSDIAKPQFIMYPTLAFAPETSWEVGLSSLYVYYAKQDTTTRLSEVSAFTFYTFNKQYGFWADHALYSHRNKWSFLGRVRFQDFPILYYGIGNHTPPDHQATVAALQLNIRERVLRKIVPNVYAGPEVDFQQLSSVHFEPNNGYPVVMPAGSGGYTNLGMGAGLIYDNRHNVLNVRKGGFAELALLHYNTGLTSDFTFTSVISDNRVYVPVKKHNVLAAQLFGQFMSRQPPFNQLSLMGGDGLMRGYYLGRFRDKNQLAGQVEFRMLPLPLKFTNRFGASIFAASGTVFPNFNSLQIQQFKWAAGAGLRFLIYPKKDIFTRVDLAFTQEGKGVYFFIGEAF